jgi:hypothetical protein
MNNMDLRNEFRIADVRQWQVAGALGVSEMTLLKWLRFELSEEKKNRVREAIEKIVQSREDHHN